MAGVVPKRAPSGRKQWSLHGGPSSSLRQLRSQLASDGCPESQVVLAKQLLDQQSEFQDENKENAKQGVYWLIKASEQGNQEATDLLKTCLENGKGITEHNFLDVKSCISMTQDEKLARKAAREMFASLSNGGDFITSDQLQKKILEIERGTTKPQQDFDCELKTQLINNYEESDSESETDWSQKSDSSNEKLTESSLLNAAVDYSHGFLPIVNRVLSLTEPNLRGLDHINFVHRGILHPWLVLRIFYCKILRFFVENCKFLSSEYQVLGLMVLYVFWCDSLGVFIPLLAFATSLIWMVVCTCKMLQDKRDFVEFRLWSGLFLCYSGGELDAAQAERQFIKNSLKFYGHFFVGLLINLFVYSWVSHHWIPQSEITILAFVLTFFTLFGFTVKKHDPLVLFSFAVNVLAKYPYETDPVVAQGWRFLDVKVPTFPSYVIGNGIEFCINFNMLLYLLIPVIFLKIASKDNWRGTYKVLIPHCVTLSWLQLCIINSQGATMFGFLRGVLALVGAVLFLPLVGLTSVILPIVALTKWIITSKNLLYSIIFFAILTSLALSTCYFLAKTRFKKYTALTQVTLMLITFLWLINGQVHKMDDFNEAKMADMTWDVFQRFCHQPSYQEENIALAQIKCAELQETKVHWDGYITNIKIKSIGNSYKKVFDHFPQGISNYLHCLYGREVTQDCDEVPDILKDDCISFYNSIKSVKACSLQDYNFYTFELTIRMQSGIWAKSSEVSLIADNFFKNFTLALKPNDQIWFKGQIFNDFSGDSDAILGGLKPHVRLSELGCIACSNNQLSELKFEESYAVSLKTLGKHLLFGAKFVLNVLLNPIVVFK